MIKKIKWSNKFLTGHKEVDGQHQYFADLINRIMLELFDNSDHKYHILLVEELILYAHFHFKSEENMLIRLNYPDLEGHKKLHRELIDSLSSKVVLLEKNTVKSIELIEFLIKWFIEHTISEDVKSFSLHKEQFESGSKP